MDNARSRCARAGGGPPRGRQLVHEARAAGDGVRVPSAVLKARPWRRRMASVTSRSRCALYRRVRCWLSLARERRRRWPDTSASAGTRALRPAVVSRPQHVVLQDLVVAGALRARRQARRGRRVNPAIPIQVQVAAIAGAGIDERLGEGAQPTERAGTPILFRRAQKKDTLAHGAAVRTPYILRLCGSCATSARARFHKRAVTDPQQVIRRRPRLVRVDVDEHVVASKVFDDDDDVTTHGTRAYAIASTKPDRSKLSSSTKSRRRPRR